jgi:hypothetical protein
MKPFHLPVCISLLFLLTILLLSCNSASEKSPDIKPAPDEKATEAPSDSAKPRDPYFVEQSEGNGKEERKAQLVKKYNSLLVFHADDTMQVNKTYLASLALARNAALNPVKIKVLEISDATDDNVIVDTTIELGKRVKATLLDLSPKNDKSFDITQIGEAEQNLSKTKESIWQWNIEPLKAGQHKLKLSIQVIESDDNTYNLPTKDIPVTIFAQKVTTGDKIANFFSNYWQWIITGILLPIIIAFLTNWIKKK